MQETALTVLRNERLADGVFRMRLQGNLEAVTTPGQFVDLRVPGLFLRRPISVCDRDGSLLTLVFRAVGRGTDALSRMTPGETVNALTGLGNGYDLPASGDRPVLVGGGVGVPPLYWLARMLRAEGKAVCVCLGFNASRDVFYEEEFRSLGAEVRLATMDGSRGVRGFATDLLPEDGTYFYACGPVPMLRTLCRKARTEGQLSLEARMGCGFGACMGCTCLTRNGPARICKEGPVFRKEEILWET